MREIYLGSEDFKEIIDGNYLYVDKTLIIKNIIDGAKSVCFP